MDEPATERERALLQQLDAVRAQGAADVAAANQRADAERAAQERLTRERDEVTRERDAAEARVDAERDATEERLKKQRVEDDTAPRPFYERLDGKCYSEIVAREDTGESATPSRRNPVVPEEVVSWDLHIPGGVEELPEFTKCLKAETRKPMLQDFKASRVFNKKWSEANMETTFLAPLVLHIWDNLKGLVPDEMVRGVAPLFQQRNAVGTIPDWLFFQSSDGFYDGGENEMDDATIVVGESKSPAKYPPEDDVDIVTGYNKNKNKHGPILQVYEYMCVAGVKYGIVSTGACTWFFERDEHGTLRISRCVRIDETSPSLPQAIAFFMVKVLMTPNKLKAPMDRHAVKAKKAAQKEARSQRDKSQTSEQKPSPAVEQSNDTSDPCYCCPVLQTQLPLEDVDFSLRHRSETYGPLNVGIAHRVPVHGVDAVVKLVDAHKEPQGVETLRQEAETYLNLRQLWGVCIAHLVFEADLNMGRYGIATTYAGPTLDRDASLLTRDVYQQTVSAVQTIHKAGYLHGDVALRNIAVLNGKVLLIDLGSARRSDDAREFELELQQVAMLFGGAPSDSSPDVHSPPSSSPLAQRFEQHGTSSSPLIRVP